MNVDVFQGMVAVEGIDNWRRPGWPESGGLASIVAAHQYRVVFRLLEPYLDSGAPKDVLDWGCGTGAFSYAIVMEGHNVWGTDPRTPPMMEFIAGAAGPRYHFDLAEDSVLLPYPDSSFDVVLSNGCLEHVGETGGSDVRSLEEIYRVLRPGGAFVCSHLPNRHSYIEAIARAIKKPAKRHFGRFVYSHEFLYTPEEIRTMAGNAGYTVTSVEAYGLIPRNPLSSLPSSIRDSEWFIRCIDGIDDGLAHPLRLVCQNLAWVGVKPR